MATADTVQSRLVVVVASLALALAAIAAPSAQTRARRKAVPRRPPARSTAPSPPRLDCGDYVGFQVLLDREGFSPGQIDGRPGVNFSHALAAFQQAHGVEPSGNPDCNTWHALGGETTAPTIDSYTITDEDAKGPFTEAIPPDLDKQAQLPALGYTSLVEKIAERFHESPALLRQMNKGVALDAGATIQVPAVPPFIATAKPLAAPGGNDVAIQVSRDDSSVRATRSDGTVVLFAPVTTGSEHDPLPEGSWKVTRVNWWPEFHYNPKLFWDAKPDQARATLKPGPNNPVGVAWIGLTLEHYGLHGTPEPSRVGHAASHGCVRMTNWDVARVASVVTRGTPVLFR